MQVYAFVGKTGTGKSYNALKVAKSYDIKYIIDDAILIKETKVIAGRSAKTEASKIASVKAAIFFYEDRKKEMMDAIKKEKIEKILILGTSDEMVQKIAGNLELGPIFKTIYIEDVATPEKIEEARKSRFEEGKHVVPVPTFEIKKQFSGYFIDPLRMFDIFRRESSNLYEAESSEKTIIRPTYSYIGKFRISDNVMRDLVTYTVEQIRGIGKVQKVFTEKYIDGMKIEVDIQVIFGYNIPNISKEVKEAIIRSIDTMTGINLFGIDINVTSIIKIK
ncbi:MAG: Asp23/Gls24 family envelope stress response protein [Clostridia bacterium]|nr:Asp23/Gls24 family envelope stress response protein [Clostridia bacterium]